MSEKGLKRSVETAEWEWEESRMIDMNEPELLRRSEVCKIWPHLTAVLNLSDRHSDFI